MIQAVRNMVEAVDIPVTADIESGYGSSSSADVAETVQALISIGVAGINIEDSPGRDGQALLTPEEHAERICVARETAAAAGGDLVINARTDVYLFAVGKPETRLESVTKRARLYRRAGADCVFVPGVINISTIAELVKAIEGPLKHNGNAGSAECKAIRRNWGGSCKCWPVDRSSGTSSGATCGV
jgi:2-methylisocitrate lyase-like PEP mutase family enzyme